MKVLDDVLQKQGSPVEYLKTLSEQKFAIIVPDEFSWRAELKPFTNPAHKVTYDAETLAEDLDGAGLVYVMKEVAFDGWAFLCVEASR